MKSALQVLTSACCTLSALALMSPAASAWTGLNGNFPIWQSMPLSYEVNASSAQELGATTAQNVIEQSYSNWSSQSCTSFRTQNTGTTQGAWRSGDQMNTHLWIYNANQRPGELAGRETIGVTLTYFSGNSLIDGDILYNGIDHSWTTNPTRGGQVDAESIITHETGHQLGLGHSQRTAATMYFAYTGGTGARSLDSDDIEGVCSLYPGSGATGCSNDDDCGPNETCGGGTCIPTTQGEGGVGDPCGQQMCADDLVCVQANNSNPFCTKICSGRDCPSGWACIGVNSNQGAINLCLPSAEGGGDASFGERCNSGPDCASGFCVSDGRSSFCTESCVDSSTCPDGAMCVGLSNGGGACVPGGGVSAGAFGDACANEGQCESGLCISDGMVAYCSEFCTRDGECPAGSACYALEDGSGACVIEEDDPPTPPPTDEPERGFGEGCDTNAECESELCVDDGSRTFCSAYCDESEPCPEGGMCVDLTTGGGACLPVAEAECSGNDDCPEEGMVCQAGACVGGGGSPPGSNGGAESPDDPPYEPREPPPAEEEGGAINSNDIGCAAHRGAEPPLTLLLLACLGSLMRRAPRGVRS